MDKDIRVNNTKLSTRPCLFSLALQDDSIFADFDKDKQDQLFLVRISFDGYGCCYPDWERMPIKMSMEDSTRLLQSVDEHKVNTPVVVEILRAYFIRCGQSIWEEALQEYQWL